MNAGLVSLKQCPSSWEKSGRTKSNTVWPLLWKRSLGNTLSQVNHKGLLQVWLRLPIVRPFRLGFCVRMFLCLRHFFFVWKRAISKLLVSKEQPGKLPVQREVLFNKSHPGCSERSLETILHWSQWKCAVNPGEQIITHNRVFLFLVLV